MHDPDGWRRISEYVTGVAILLIEGSDDDHLGFRFEDRTELTRVLEESSNFVFYVTDPAGSYLLAFNDHDYLIAAGTARAWLSALTLTRSRWDVTTLGPLSEPMIRSLRREERVRISRCAYEAGETHAGRSIRSQIFVLAGQLTFETPNGERLSASCGDIVDFTGGDYHLTSGDEPAAAIWVWNLPAGVG